MQKRNCPNCAALYDVLLSKCPYCGTSCFDLSAIDLSNGEPFYLKLKVKIGNMDFIVTQLVKPNYNVSTDCEYDCNRDSKLISFKNSQTLKTNLNFEAIPDKKNNYMTLEIAE